MQLVLVLVITQLTSPGTKNSPRQSSLSWSDVDAHRFHHQPRCIARMLSTTIEPPPPGIWHACRNEPSCFREHMRLESSSVCRNKLDRWTWLQSLILMRSYGTSYTDIHDPGPILWVWMHKIVVLGQILWLKMHKILGLVWTLCIKSESEWKPDLRFNW